MYWNDVYPHKIWTNILVFDKKLIDYKIGESERSKGSWTIRWSDELIENFHTDRVRVISSYEEVNNSTEHNKAFDNGQEKVNKHIAEYGFYYNDEQGFSLGGKKDDN